MRGSIPVISHNVIRQAIEWHNVPEPTFVSTVSNFTFPNGKYQATLHAQFNMLDLFKVYTGVELLAGRKHGFLVDLQNCFCRDIQVIGYEIDAAPGHLCVILSCTVEPHDYDQM